MLLLVFMLLSYLIFLVYMYFTSMLNKVVVYKILESRSMLHLTGRPGHPSNRSYSLQIFLYLCSTIKEQICFSFLYYVLFFSFTMFKGHWFSLFLWRPFCVIGRKVKDESVKKALTFSNISWKWFEKWTLYEVGAIMNLIHGWKRV